MYYLYILECEDGSLYTGITDDLARRFEEHRRGLGGHYTASHRVRRIAYVESLQTKGDALRREIQVKRLERKKKLALIRPYGRKRK